jgi:hypothetical protein
MTEGFRLVGEVEEVTDNNIDENAEVVGVKVLMCCASGEK